MVRLKDKEQRGVGLQNMTYSNPSSISSCSHLPTYRLIHETFSKHLGGAKTTTIQATVVRSVLPNKRKVQLQSSSVVSRTGQDQRTDESLYVPPLSICDIDDVDLSTFPASSAIQMHEKQVSQPGHGDEMVTTMPPAVAASALTSIPTSCRQLNKLARSPPAGAILCELNERRHEDLEVLTNAAKQDHDGVIDESTETSADGRVGVTLTPDYVPCTGLRDENVQAYVASAVQIVGGIRPRYVIARLSCFHRMLYSASAFGEWTRKAVVFEVCAVSDFVPAPGIHDRGRSQSQGVCRACRDLRTVPNFRSVLSRFKMPKNLENIKYVPSVYTEAIHSCASCRRTRHSVNSTSVSNTLTTQAAGKNSEAGADNSNECTFGCALLAWVSLDTSSHILSLKD
ncbi:unnamed protein product [Peronospora belbahrii]|uniref:Uncharacterized protein n=1 Tax=Peronospora belbahrii TaxID=622444 RepID=A0ABN8CSI4_9STRA|nr:unnamed protein product [Peronospora belbahrii]